MAESPEIDFTSIDFPSDGLTIKALRRLHPAEIDSTENLDLEEGRGKLASLLGDLLFTERGVAKDAFNHTLSRRERVLGDSENRDACLAGLVKLYTDYGIASGQHHAEQLIRNIASQAEVQARQHSGKRP